MVERVNRYEVWLVKLDPTKGSEIRKTRPCAIVSPSSMNKTLKTVTIVPMTSTPKQYPWRVPVSFQGKNGYLVTDQIRAADKTRLVKRLGTLEDKTADQLSETLVEMFEK